MKQIYLKSKRAFRFLFYRHLSINEQLVISEILKSSELITQYWLLNKADRHHSIEVMSRSNKLTNDSEVLCLSLLHDIGKNTSHYSWLFRILAEMKIITNTKAQNYLHHEDIGLTVLRSLKNAEGIARYYENELLKQRHDILDKTDY